MDSREVDTSNRSLMSSDGTRAVMETPDHWWACFTGFVMGDRHADGKFIGQGVGSVNRWEVARDFLDGKTQPDVIKYGLYPH